jgi:hypothetical protein
MIGKDKALRVHRKIGTISKYVSLYKGALYMHGLLKREEKAIKARKRK